MATPPLWNEIESNPNFQGLAPEQKSKVLSGWSQQVIELAKTPEEKLAVEAVADAKLKFFAGAPMPENMGEYVQTYAQQKAQQEVDAKAKEKADRPFFGFGDTLNALGTIASNLPTNVKAAAYQLKEGLAMPSERSQGYLDAMAEKRAADEAVQADQAQREAQGLATSVGSAGREFSNSSGFSGVAMGAAFAGGEAGAAIGTPIGAALGAGAGGVGAVPGAGAGSLVGATVGAIGGLVSSGAAAYRMAGATFLDDAFDMANKQSIEEKGRPLNKEEEKSLYDQVLPIAQNTALWEAGPEAIGNVFTMGVGKLLFKGVGKEALQQAGTNLATRALATGTAAAGKAPVSATRNLLNKAGLVAADVGVELAGETATQVGGQGWDQAKLEALLAGKNPADVANPYAGAAGIAKGFEEIAPATLFGSALMGGGAGLVGLAKEQYVKAQAAKAQQIADTASSLIQVGAPQTSAALVQTAVEVASTPPAEAIAPTPSEENAPPTPIETQENAPTQERQVESPSGTPPVQGQPVVETATGQVEEGTPPRQGQGEVTTIKVAAKPAVMARPAATPEVRVTSAPTPTQVEETSPAATTVKVAAKPTVLPKPAKAPEVRVAPVQGYPRQALKDEVGKSIAKWSSGDLAAFDAFVRTGDSETIAKLGVIKRQVANRVGRALGVTIAEPKRIGVPGVTKKEPVVAEKEAPAEKPKRFRRNPRFSDNPNTNKPDILNFVAGTNMVIPSARLKTTEKKAGKSVGGERDALKTAEDNLTKGEREMLWTVQDKIPFDANTIDVVAQAAFDNTAEDGTPEPLISAPTADALIEAIVQASKERKAGSLADQQQAILDDQEKQTKAFDEAVTTPAKDKERIASSEVVVGNKYTILGEEFTVTEITYDEADGTPIGLVLTSPTFGTQRASLEEPFYVTKKEAPKKQAGLESLLEGTESTRPKNKGETAKPQAADPLAELGAATRAGKAEQDQGKMELPPATEEQPTPKVSKSSEPLSEQEGFEAFKKETLDAKKEAEKQVATARVVAASSDVRYYRDYPEEYVKNELPAYILKEATRKDYTDEELRSIWELRNSFTGGSEQDLVNLVNKATKPTKEKPATEAKPAAKSEQPTTSEQPTEAPQLTERQKARVARKEAANEVAEQDRSLPTTIGGEMAEDLAEDIRTSLSEQVPSGKVVGGITEQNAKNGLDLITKLIPMARRMVRLATSAELLADETLTPDERASVRSGAQGYYSMGKVVLVTDQVKQTIFHKNADVAAAATILHEMMHHGTSVIRDNKLFYASWLKLVSEYVTDAQIERLVNVQGYSAYADWRTDMAVKEKAMEEIFVRQLEGLFVRKGSLSFVEKNKLQKFLSWLKEFVNSALGLPKGTQIPDSHLEEMGWRFVAAIESAQFVERTQDVRESAPDLGSLPPQSRTSPLSAYTDEEKASLEKYFEENPDTDGMFTQILGLKVGSVGSVQKVQTSADAAYAYLQLGQDPKTGRPIVGKSDETRILNIAAQLTASGSNFGAEYQARVGTDAATGVLQMILTQAGLEMSKRGDSRLIEMMRKNWNGIVMGAFMTYSSSGRLLQVRSNYKNEVLDSLYEREQQVKAAGIKYLQEQGVENAEAYAQSVENLLQKAKMDEQALEKLRKLVAGIKVGPQDGLMERITEALKYTGGEIERAFTQYTKAVLLNGNLKKAAQNLRDKKAASSASQSFADELGVEEPLPVFGSLEELEKLIVESDKEVAKLGKALGKALGKKDGRGTGGKVEGPGTGTITGGEAPPVDEETVEDLDEAEDENEATEAAKRVLENLKAFLEQKFSNKTKTASIYSIIKKMVDANIANTSEKAFKDFQVALRKELSVHDIEESVLEKLVNTAWTTFTRYPEKRAEALIAKFQAKAPKNPVLKPEKVNQLNKLVKKYLRNKDNLEEDAFLDKLIKEMSPLDVSRETAEELAEEVYMEHLERKEKAFQARLKRTKESLLGGGRKTLIAQIQKATQGEVSDPAWQDEALRNVLTKSGVLTEELEDAMDTFTEDEKATIFETTIEKMAKTAADNINKSVARLTKRYEKYLATPTNQTKPVPSPSLRKLIRNQVRVATDKALFVANAATFGATEAQANRLFDLATVERSLRDAEQTKLTKMEVLIDYIMSQPTALVNDPKLRNAAIQSWLMDNGYTSQEAIKAGVAIGQSFDLYVQEAQMKAIEKMKVQISSRVEAEKKNKGTPAEITKAKDTIAKIQEEIDAAPNDINVIKPLVDKLNKAKDALGDLLPRSVADQQVAKLQRLIRMGLGNGQVDPTKAFAKEMGYKDLEKSDYIAFAELDLKITTAKQDQRMHDYAIGIKELFDLLARRKGDMSFIDRLAISYNNSALSGLGTLAINIIAPMGALMTRVGLDMGVAVATGDIEKVNQIFTVLRDCALIIKNEVKFSIVGGANTNDWARVITNATSLQQPLIKAMAIVKDPNASPMSRLTNSLIVVQSYTDITRRVLMATDHVWFSVFENYFLKTQALSLMTRANVKNKSEVMALLFSVSSGYSSRLSNELGILHQYENAFENLRGVADSKTSIEEILATPLDAMLSVEARAFEEDLRGDIRRAIRPSGMSDAKVVRLALGAVRLQRTLANLRVRDNMARDIKLRMREILPDADLSTFVEKEKAYELGVHRGEEGPAYDVVNTVTQMVHLAGSSVIRRNPIIGRMLLGYFGIPANLLNRAMWFTPYGLIRYAIAAKARGNLKVPPNSYYQQSMATNEQIRQRLVEAVVGTTAVTLLMSLKALMGDDDDDAIFNVTLAGPTPKTENDAWKKAGHRQGSVEIRVGDKIIALNAMRGPMEPLKIGLLMVGAMDDMRLNRKENDGEFGQYLSEYLTAMLSGWSKQASFFGAKSTIGATLAVNPDASVVSTALYKLNPIIPFSGLISSVEKLMTGGDRFRGREGSIYLNLPIARSLLTQKAVNALGDPQGLNPSSAWTESNERAWWAGFPLMVSGTPTGNDKKVYEFILDRGIAPGLPQRTALENKNGVMSDTSWQDYVAVRGTFIKRAMIRDLARLRKMDDDSAAKALGQISTDATAAAKKQLRYK